MVEAISVLLFLVLGLVFFPRIILGLVLATFVGITVVFVLTLAFKEMVIVAVFGLGLALVYGDKLVELGQRMLGKRKKGRT